MKELKFGILNELYGSQLSIRQREIVRCYYDFDLSLSEIADNYGITRQAANDALRKGERSLDKFESEMGFFAKLNHIKADAEKILTLLDENKAADAKAAAEKLLDRL